VVSSVGKDLSNPIHVRFAYIVGGVTNSSRSAW